MLGGGKFISQNKILPGAYMNYVSAAKATATLSDRGIVAAPFLLDWGVEGDIFQVELSEFEKYAQKIFGYSIDDPVLRDVREIFKNAKTLVAYRLNGGGNKATVTIANLVVTAKYSGIRGNALKIVIAANVNEPTKFDVSTYLGIEKVDLQTVGNITGLVANDYVLFSGTGTLTATAGTLLTGGTNKAVTGTDYSAFLDKAESYAFHTMSCPSFDAPTVATFVSYVKRRRDENGVNFQLVVYRTAADYEGVIAVENTVLDVGANAAALVYWVSGLEASMPVNKSATNKVYTGEYFVDTNYTQTALELNLKAGKFMLHRVGKEVRILDDVNTFVSATVLKCADFSSNQVMRVLDQSGNDLAVLFNTKYNGEVPNDAAGRISLWSDIVSYYKSLLALQAIENFSPDEVTVDQGTEKKAVVVCDAIQPVAAMSKMYKTTVVR